MSIPPPVNPSMPFHLPNTGVNVDVTEKKIVKAKNTDNIVQVISDEIEKKGPGAVVEYCHGTVERTNPEDPNSPFKVSTYFNKQLHRHCYQMHVTWEIKIKTADGKEEILEISQLRKSTFRTPSVNTPGLQTEYAYRSTLIGTEYAKSISSVFDPNAPDHATMLEQKANLLANDNLHIKVRLSFIDALFHNLMGSSDDPYIRLKGFGIAEVSWKDSMGAKKKYKVIDRDYSKELYKIDTVTNRIIRAGPNDAPDGKTVFNGVDILKRDKVSVTSKWFDKLKSLESVEKDEIVQELQKAEVEEADYIGRISRRARETFYSSLKGFGHGEYPQEDFPKILTRINELRAKINKEKDDVKYLTDVQENYNTLQGYIDELKNFQGQLEVLLERHPVISAIWSAPGGTGYDNLVARWSPTYIGKRIAYLEALRDTLQPALGNKPNAQVIPS